MRTFMWKIGSAQPPELVQAPSDSSHFTASSPTGLPKPWNLGVNVNVEYLASKLV